jgi:uncharacterized membrane protein HdeD (DUF308 family)
MGTTGASTTGIGAGGSGSAQPPTATRHGLGYKHVSERWGWFIALGVVLLLLGILALGDVVAVTVASTIFIGAAFMIGGIVQVIHAFATKGWSAFLIYLVGGIVTVIGGFLIMQEPVRGSIVITLFLTVAMLVSGVMRMVIAFRHREIKNWWLLLLSGLVSMLLGLMLFMSLPWSGLWVLGTLVAVELLLQGGTWLQFGLSLRRMRRHADGHAAAPA